MCDMRCKSLSKLICAESVESIGTLENRVVV